VSTEHADAVWVSELRHVETGEWRTWTCGSFEDVVADLVDFRQGQFGDTYGQARIISPERQSR